jgi:predicted peptidase
MFALSLTLTSQVAAAPRQTVSGVKSVTMITDVLTFGQKNMAIAVEYASIVNPLPLALDTFIVKDPWYDFRFDAIAKMTDLRPRTITKVYTNSVKDTRPDGLSVPGKYVIVELSALDYGGSLIRTAVNTSYVMINESMPTQVIQKKDVYAYTDGVSLGTPLGAGGTTVYTPSQTNRTNHWADQFVYGEFCCQGTSTILPYRYFVPPDPEPGHLYPMVVIMPGNGMGYNGTNPGVDVVADIPATAWLRPEWKLTNEGVIVLAPQSRRTGAAQEATAILTLMDQFMAAFPVDPTRVYFTTCSYGGTIAWTALSQRPGFFSSGLLTGGMSVSTTQAAAIANDLTPIYITHGLYDHLINVSNGRTSRDRMRAAYVAKGLTAAEAAALLPYLEIDTPDFTNQINPAIPGYAEPDNHAVDGPTYATSSRTGILQWLLAVVH